MREKKKKNKNIHTHRQISERKRDRTHRCRSLEHYSLFLFYTRVELYLNYSLGIKNNLALFFYFSFYLLIFFSLIYFSLPQKMTPITPKAKLGPGTTH